MMINRFNIHILVLFGFLYSGIAIPDSDAKDWTVLNDGKTWVGHKDYKGFPWCRSISNLPFSIDEIVPIVDNFDNYSNIFLRINDSRKIEENIVYLKIDMPLFYSDRDYIVEYQSFEENDIVTYQWGSIQHPEIPVFNDFVRLPDAAGEWSLTPINDSLTTVSYSWNGQLLGNFPSFGLTQAWSTQGLEIMSWLKEELEKSHD